MGAFDSSGNYQGLLANSDTRISIPFVRPSAFTGTVQSVAGSVVTVAQLPNWPSNSLVNTAGLQPNTYFALFGAAAPGAASNPKEGYWYFLTANVGSTVTLALNGDNITGVPVGSSVTLIPCWTLNTLFPAANANVSFASTRSA